MSSQFFLKTDINQFKRRFELRIPFSRSYLISNDDLGKGVPCGYIHNNRFYIWKNIGMRSISMLFCEILEGSFSDDGSILYKFKKRIDGLLFIIGFSLMCLIAGIIFSNQYQDFRICIPFAIVAVFVFSLFFLSSKKNRNELSAILNAIADQKE